MYQFFKLLRHQILPRSYRYQVGKEPLGVGCNINSNAHDAFPSYLEAKKRSSIRVFVGVSGCYPGC